MRRGVVLAALLMLVTGVVWSPAWAAAPGTTTPIRHVVYLMQGARSFDNYFGTYPGVDGIPVGTCQRFSATRPAAGCVKPFSLHGSTPPPLAAGRSLLDAQYHGGTMDGFVAAFSDQGRDGSVVMGHYDQQDLPYYWNTAQRYVLFDHFFASAPYGVRQNRGYWVAAAAPPISGDKVPASGYGDQPTIFDRLQAAGIGWKFYVQGYDPTQTYRAITATNPAGQSARVPLLDYPRFLDRPQLHDRIVGLDQYYTDLAHGTLPAVAFVTSSGASERSARSIPAGQALVRTMVTQLMTSRYWHSSALVWTYDGTGGWYDHVAPPSAGGDRLGFRVPALLVSPYARPGRVDHTTLEYPSVLRFIEDNWRLKPLSGRDRHAASIASAFDFTAPPHRAKIIPAEQPAAAPAPLVPVAIVYVCYGSALLLGLLLVIIAHRRWRPAPPGAAITPGPTGPAAPGPHDDSADVPPEPGKSAKPPGRSADEKEHLP
jgi:phospholipase C